MSFRGSVLLASIIVSISAAPSAADPIRIDFGGYLVPTPTHPLPAITIRFNGSLTYDPEKAAPSTEDRIPGIYRLGGDSAFHLAFDGSQTLLDSSDLDYKSIVKVVSSDGSPPGSADLLFWKPVDRDYPGFELKLVSDSPSSYNSTSPPFMSDIGPFTRGTIEILARGSGDGLSMESLYRGQIDTVRVVPEPSSAILAILVGALGMHRYRRR